MANPSISECGTGLCQCGCGQPTAISRWTDKRKGITKGKPYRFAHGHGTMVHGKSRVGSRSSEYGTWAAMKERCSNPKNRSYANYGGRGITVCERWESFENFLADMGPRPPGKTLGRLNNNEGYSPTNCAWRSSAEQAQNTRKTRLNLEAVKVIRFMLRRGVSQVLLGRLHGSDQANISRIALGKIWKEERRARA